ncbi:hypothetical protein FKM82_015960 [Ascaphus truei]
MWFNIIADIAKWTVSLPAVIGNMFIFAVNILDWTKNKRLSSSDQIIFGLSVLNILQRILKMCSYFIPERLHLVTTVFTYSLMAVLYCNLWFFNWLCVHYCLKIVNINQLFYIDLQRKFHKMVPWLLILSTLGSCLMMISIVWDNPKEFSPNTTYANHKDLLTCTTCYIVPIYVALSLIAFLMSSISVLTILTSLYRHMKRMRHNADGFRSPSVEAHVRAVKTLTSLLVLNIFIYFIMILYIVIAEDRWMHFINIALPFHPALSALILIRGNMKLKKTFERMLCYFSCTRAANIQAIG